MASQAGPSDEELKVIDDDHDFYGKQYWLEHQSQELGFSDIYARARTDLAERNLHWLKTLLKYLAPPSKVLELGSSHGSFIALMRQAGYAAAGVEMSPWVVEYGQKTFDVPVSIGPVESLDIALGSLDAIVLMDVLEHLPDPAGTMAHCLKLLKPDGLVLIQTPQFQEGTKHEALVKTKAPFLEMLIPDEHIYLFSQRSAIHLFHQLGAEHIKFEPAIFGQYDMFFVVSRLPLQANTPEQMVASLLATPSGRIALAILDLQQRELDLARKWTESESDRTARGMQIETLTKMLTDSNADRAARGLQIETLTKMLTASEADRAARAAQIETLTAMLITSDADRAARGTQIELLTRMLTVSEADRAARGTQIDTLAGMLKESEADRLVRGERIDALLGVSGKQDGA